MRKAFEYQIGGRILGRTAYLLQIKRGAARKLYLPELEEWYSNGVYFLRSFLRVFSDHKPSHEAEELLRSYHSELSDNDPRPPIDEGPPEDETV